LCPGTKRAELDVDYSPPSCAEVKTESSYTCTALNKLQLFSTAQHLLTPWSRVPLGKITGDRIPVGARFSAPVQTGPEAHSASCTRSTRSFPGYRAARAWRWPLTSF